MGNRGMFLLDFVISKIKHTYQPKIKKYISLKKYFKIRENAITTP